ncbi:CHIA chitinase, partial [Sagittarius serpentarius]|nr:CHIA chitinase [Sagittarius serpentarius]
QNPSDTAIGAPTSGPGPAGPYTKQTGVLAYYKVTLANFSLSALFSYCKFLDSGATQAWDASQDVPSAYKGNKWVAYDNIKSFNIKADWLEKNNFGGAMVWALDLDDFTSTCCKERKYPLITALKNCLGLQKGDHVPPTQPSPPVTKGPCTTDVSGSRGSGVSDFCAGKASGICLDPTNKRIFYNCINGKTFVRSCDDGLIFDTSCSCCNWP